MKADLQFALAFEARGLDRPSRDIETVHRLLDDLFHDGLSRFDPDASRKMWGRRIDRRYYLEHEEPEDA